MEQQQLAVFTPPGNGPAKGDDDCISHNKAHDEDSSFGVSQLFNVRKPGHIGTGLISGAGNVIKGVALGAGSLIAAPVIGYSQNGPKGALKGLGYGVAAAVALPVAGVVTGVGQVGTGALNTVQAVQEIGKGTVYNEKTQKWEPKYRRLSEQYESSKIKYEEYSAEKAKRHSPPHGSPVDHKAKRDSVVVDTEYYDVLQVAPTASAADIRKAYYRLAREHHPDKHPDDPSAKDRFQRIGEAYQILGNESSRAQYDQHGKAVADEVEFVDHSLFFAILFGSEEMTPFVGNLMLGSMMANGEENDKVDLSLHMDEREQAWREAQLAVSLRDRLEPGVKALQTNDKAAYKEWLASQRQKAESLCTQSFGWQLVDSIGFSYENYAKHFLAKKNSFLQMGTAKTKFRKTSRQMGTVMSALKAVKSANDASKKARRTKTAEKCSDSGMTQEEIQCMEEGMKHVLKAMLQICLHDVLSTLRSTCQLYLNDKSVGVPVQELRAHCLDDVGELFQQSAKDYKLQRGESMDPREYMQDAYIKMAQKMDERNNSPST